ncbi:hypothetical protein DBR06_SOUSAS4710034 [Sousa chinensis]|nr:hypothetical protein DBR06_SOUSAS4710034 [Sousa chinensis]
MYYDFFPDNFNPNGYWGNYMYSLGHCTDCGYGNILLLVGCGLDYGYRSYQPLGCKRYWATRAY